jgi:tetraacyldisaccharide 4'-kinase
MKKYLYQLASRHTKGAAAAVLKFLLWILSLFYFLAVETTYYLYALGLIKRYRLGCKVLSVGNITWGGTGKTPVAAMLAKYLKEQGKKPAILIRGYKNISSAAENSYKRTGDEAFMLSEILSVPVLTGKNRVKTGRTALKDLSVDTLILDDGFQHWRLRRDWDIVVVDCTNAFGNGFLIPRGILREPLSALKRAQVFFLTKTDVAGLKTAEIKRRLSRINPAALIVESIHQPVGFGNLLHPEESFAPAEVKSQDVALVCSIGNPDAFIKTVTGLKLNPVLKFCFLDHHHYKQEEVADIIDSCQRYHVNTVITTHKDAVRLKDHFAALDPELSVLVLQIEIAITKGSDEFFSGLSRLYPA